MGSSFSGGNNGYSVHFTRFLLYQMDQNFWNISKQTLIPTFVVLNIQIMTKMLFSKPLCEKHFKTAQIFLET